MKKITFYSILFYSILLFNSCVTSNEYNPTELTNRYLFHIDNLQIPFDYNYSYPTPLTREKTSTRTFKFNLAKTSDFNISNVMRILKPKMVDSNSIVGITPVYLVLYLKSNFEVVTTDSISLQQVDGFSILYNQSGLAMHKLFRKNYSDEFKEYLPYSGKYYSNSIRLDFIYYTALKNTLAQSYLIIKSNSQALIQNSNYHVKSLQKSAVIDFDQNSLNKIILDSASSLAPSGGSNGDGAPQGVCGTFYYCGGPGSLTCGVEPDAGGTLVCIFPRSCYDNAALKPAIEETNTFNPYVSTLGIVFRDSSMVNTVKGQRYIDYYYKISNVLELTETSIIDKIAFAQFGIKVYGCAYKLMYGDNNEIVYDNDDLTRFKFWIEEFRNVTVNSEYQNILNDITLDLNKYVNKSRGFILNDL